MSDRIAIMRDGRIVQVGRPRELYEHPRNAFVASFLGEANLFEVAAVRGTGRGLASCAWRRRACSLSRAPTPRDRRPARLRRLRAAGGDSASRGRRAPDGERLQSLPAASRTRSTRPGTVRYRVDVGADAR